MKIALVHDFIKEFGGAERVLRVLADMYPEAPIYTSFKIEGSTAAKAFEDRRIVESPWGWLIKHANLYSPLRFLAPWIWGSLDLRGYDLVITSCSSYFARGFKMDEKARLVAYCHTPPRFLYGYETSVDWRKYWIVKMYSVVVNHFLRIFDYQSAQRVNLWIVNSKNVADRVRKVYRKDSQVVYPPVEVENLIVKSKGVEKEDYYLIVSRLVGAKGLVEAAKAMKKMNRKLAVVGEAVGFSQIEEKLRKMDGVELLGRLSDEKLAEKYARARGFLALAKEEDFGITVVESMASGTPVIAFNGGGFKETVVDGKTGVLVGDLRMGSLLRAVKTLERKDWSRSELIEQARKFSKEKFVQNIRTIVG